MSSDPPDTPDGDPPESGDPSDLRSVEGLSRDSDGLDPSASMSVVELPRASRPDRPDDTETDDDYALYEVESLPRGTQLGRYVLLGRVSGRDEGVVYGAYDPQRDHKIGLKLFLPGGDEDKDARTLRMQLVRQAQRVAELSHPCVEQVYEAGVYGPWVFLATEFIDGIDVAQWMEARDDPFPWPEVLRVFREAGRGLAAAHKLGVVHRDFNPSNVIMGKGGRLVVVDFGLAHQVEEAIDDIDISQLRESMTGSSDDVLPAPMSGTPAYMAPEQHLSGMADARSDQFSFCVALYEALYGERPFSGNRPRAIALEAAKHKVRAAPEGSTVPAWLRAVVVRGLSPRPDDRFPSMEALLRELARDPVDRRRRWGWGVVLVGGLAATGGLMAVQVEADRSACEDAGDDKSMGAIWTEARREAIHGAFEATERQWADPTWRYTETKLDDWSSEWRDLSERACLATRVWADASEHHYELRRACLEQHLDGFEATLEVLAEVDGPMLDRAHELASHLPGPRQCTDTETLVALGLPPEAQRDAVAELHRELARFEARLRLGGTPGDIEAISAVLSRIESIDDPALRARGLLALGQAHLAAGRSDAEASLHDAARAALLAGHPRLAAEAWLLRMGALTDRNRSQEASALGDYIDALVRHNRFTWLGSTLEIARGNADLAHARPAEALGHYHAAVEREEQRQDVDRLRLVPAWMGQSEVSLARGDLDGALPPLQTALDVTRDTLGPHHPAAIPVLERMGRVQRAQGQLDDARSHFEQALELVRRSYGDDARRRAELEASIGTLLVAEGNPLRAVPHLEQAYEAAGGPAAALEPPAFQLGLALARAHQDAGQAGTAREVLEALLEPYTGRAYPLAAAAGERDTPLAERSEAELMLASLLWQAGDPMRAHALAAAVLERLEDTPGHEIYRKEAQRWVEEHPRP